MTKKSKNITLLVLISLFVIVFILIWDSSFIGKQVSNGEGKEVNVEVINTTPKSFLVGEQQVRIIPFLEQTQEYIKTVQSEQNSDRDKYYQTLVVNPFREMVFGQYDGYWLNNAQQFATPNELETLQLFVQELDKEFEQIYKLIKKSIEDSTEVLPGEDIDIYVFPFNPDQRYAINAMNGVAGFYIGNNAISLYIAPDSYDENLLKYTVSHEYHHSITLNEKNGNKELLSSILIEGKADTFASSIYPETNVPWIEELTNEERSNVWKWLEDKEDTTEIHYVDEMRNGNNLIPQWSNYRLGYEIMKSFKTNNPQVTIREWTYMSEEEILERSSYEKNIKD